MSFIQFLKSIEREHSSDIAIIDSNHNSYTYAQLINEIDNWYYKLENQVSPSMVVGIYGDFSFNTVSIFFALIELKSILVPLSLQNKDLDLKKQIANISLFIDLSQPEPSITKLHPAENNTLVQVIANANRPGIIIFSSGSTGEPKAALHDFTMLLSKFNKPRTPYRSIVFLLFDHWGGINTLLHILSCGGTACFPKQRDPDYICQIIEQHQLNLLPSTPTFLNLILINRTHKKYNLSSLKLITYGTESMPESTLLRLNKEFPETIFKQTYGLTELGVMRTISQANNSLWIKVGGEDYETKIVNDLLFIRTKSSIIGYLNAPSPFDSEGWYNTGDLVATDGDWIKFLGRDSDIINVGGQKVFPAEIESIIMSIPWVVDCVVFGEKNPITGMNVSCNIVLDKQHQIPENPVLELKKWCKQNLENYKCPARVKIVDATIFNERFKKSRKVKN